VITDEIQQALRNAGIDGWLFFDHHRRDPIAYRILGLGAELQPTRRWYYLIPAYDEPVRLVHRIESGALDSIPGSKRMYAGWLDLQRSLQEILSPYRRVAMQYSPNCSVPYVAIVDAGTVDFVRSCGVEVVTSADLVQQFEARWTDEQLASHLEAGSKVDQVRRDAFGLISSRVKASVPISEYEVQQFVLERFAQSGLVTNHGPIVAVNANASNPHYEPGREKTSLIDRRDLVLIDMWAKLNRPNAVYYDITWTGFCGENIPDEIRNVFGVVQTARGKACDFVIHRVSQAQSVQGWEVDVAARSHIDAEGYGEFFFHRTGHSIGTDVHGTGANMDNLESHDERRLIPGTCFSIEPGIYLPDFGIRSEVNVYVSDNSARVTGEEQSHLLVL
jgi:Xaa-Pro dipeptidase